MAGGRRVGKGRKNRRAGGGGEGGGGQGWTCFQGPRGDPDRQPETQGCNGLRMWKRLGFPGHGGCPGPLGVAGHPLRGLRWGWGEERSWEVAAPEGCVQVKSAGVSGGPILKAAERALKGWGVGQAAQRG